MAKIKNIFERFLLLRKSLLAAGFGLITIFASAFSPGLRLVGLWIGLLVLWLGVLGLVFDWVNGYLERRNKSRIALQIFRFVMVALMGVLLPSTAVLGWVLWRLHSMPLALPTDSSAGASQVSEQIALKDNARLTLVFDSNTDRKS